MTAAEQYPDVFDAFRKIGIEGAPELFDQWLDFHLPALAGKSPRQLIQEGDEKNVLVLLNAIAEGLFT